MTDNHTPELARERVSVSQRIVPATSFALTAIGGILGAWWMLQLFQRLRGDESVTVKRLMIELGSIAQTVGLIYGLAALIGLVAVVVMFMRSSDDEASMPGFAYLVGLPTLISPSLTSYAINMAIAVFHASGTGDYAKVGAQIAELIIISIITGVVALILLLPFTFLPFSARIGKRFSPVIVIGFVLIGIIVLAATSFWLVGLSQEPTSPAFGK